MRAYPRYRDSGVEWLGEVPEHWEARRLKDVGRLIAGAAFPEALQGVGGEELPFFKVGDLNKSLDGRWLDGTEHTISRETATELRARVIPRESIVYAKIGAALLLNRRRLTTRPACIDNNMSAYVPDRARVTTQWALYTLSLIDFGEHVNPGAVPSLSEGDQAILPIPLPPLDEQRAIAAFLDRETERIDALVAKKRLLIERLDEYRAALITRTVTRGLPPEAARAAGLDPSPRLKPSGVEWLGEVPEHWEVGNIRRYAEMKSGHTPSRQQPEYWEDCYIPWFTLADVWQLRDLRTVYAGETRALVSEVGLANSAAKLLPAGTVMLSRTASVGFSGIMPVPMATSQDYWNWVCGTKLIPNYLLLAFRAMRTEFDRLMRGSTHRTIYEADAASFHIPVPPVDEQQAIITFLGERLPSTDAASDAAALTIERLQEYRTALITAAVTGKIDVRE